MSRPILTPVVLLHHHFASPELCAFRDGGADTMWMGEAVVTTGPPAILTDATAPQERANNWGSTLIEATPEGTTRARYLFNMSNQAIPSDFGSDGRSRSAMDAASWFMGCLRHDDPKWPAVWDLAPHMLTPFPFTASDGYPLAFAQEGKHSPVEAVRKLAAQASHYDSIQPWFMIGWDYMSGHEKLQVRAGIEASIRLHAMANLWDRIYDIAPALVIG